MNEWHKNDFSFASNDYHNKISNSSNRKVLWLSSQENRQKQTLRLTTELLKTKQNFAESSSTYPKILKAQKNKKDVFLHRRECSEK